MSNPIFTLEITGGTSAFGETCNSRRTKIAQLLRETAQKIGASPDHETKILDADHNVIGEFNYTPDAPVQQSRQRAETKQLAANAKVADQAEATGHAAIAAGVDRRSKTSTEPETETEG